jgi:hypothetical protein
MKAHFDAFVSLEHAIPVEPSLRVQMNRDAKIAFFSAALNERLLSARRPSIGVQPVRVRIISVKNWLFNFGRKQEEPFWVATSFP